MMSFDDATRKYFQLWGILLGLLTLSVISVWLGHGVLSTLIVYGVAVIKAWIVLRDYMHLKLEPGFITVLLFGALSAVVVLFVLVYPDVVGR